MKTFTKRLLTNQTNQTQATESDHMTTTSSVLGLLVDKDDLTNYQLLINYQLLPSCYQPTFDTGGSVDDS